MNRYSAIGRLLFTADGRQFVCSASMIAPNLVITAAHCVAEFGQSTCYSEVSFTASQYGTNGYLYVANWAAIYLPTSYYDGSDVCDPGAPGIVCENDIALVVLENISLPSNLAGQRPGDVGGYFNFASGDYGYTDLNGNGPLSAQITQTGVSCNLENCEKIFATYSIGSQTGINGVQIGSGSSGGSSGGPWLVNFGVPPSDSSASGNDAQANTVMATTSWGYQDPIYKVQGASRFDTNQAFPTVSNVQSLVDAYCCQLSVAQRAAQCADRAPCGSPPPPPPPPPPATAPPAMGTTGNQVYYASNVAGSTWSTRGLPSEGSTTFTPPVTSVSIGGSSPGGGMLDSAGYMWFSQNVAVSSPSWRRLSSTRVNYYTTDGERALATLSGRLYLCQTPPSCQWATRSTGASNGVTQVAISGLSVVALDRQTSAMRYTADIVSGSSSSWTTISLSGRTMNQISISRSGSTTQLVGVTTDGGIVYCASAPSCGAWESFSSYPSSLPISSVSISGDYVTAVDTSGSTFYTLDGITWTRNSDAPIFNVAGVSSFTLPVAAPAPPPS